MELAPSHPIKRKLGDGTMEQQDFQPDLADEDSLFIPEVISETKVHPDDGYVSSRDVETDSDSGNSTDSDDEPELMQESGYSEEVEPFPQCPAYDKDFAQLGKDVGGIASGVISIVDKSKCTSQMAISCRQNAQDLVVVPDFKRKRIAIYGKTGVGKSTSKVTSGAHADCEQARAPF